jgi:NAD+ diphosphatase
MSYPQFLGIYLIFKGNESHMKMKKDDVIDTSYAMHTAIFFTDEGVLLDLQNCSPLLCFTDTVKKLEPTIKSVYLDGSVLFIYCNVCLPFDQISNNGFRILNPKKFLNLVHNEEIQQILLRAIHWLNWDQRLLHCSKCGNKLQNQFDIAEKKCQSCDLSFFPKLSPAIMVLIKKENYILLARSLYFKPGVYSALAGFLDIGETAELAVHREVKEEVDLEITDLEYFGSQSWPFPDSFMIAFKAKYLRGEINIDVNELEDAQWFNIKNLPELPPHPSISRKLIESTIFENEKI